MYKITRYHLNVGKLRVGGMHRETERERTGSENACLFSLASPLSTYSFDINEVLNLIVCPLKRIDRLLLLLANQSESGQVGAPDILVAGAAVQSEVETN
jgi:hypothetical protein